MDDVYKRDLKANEHIYYIESPIQIWTSTGAKAEPYTQDLL